MNLLDTLKQFKHIEPDPAYTARSRRVVLATQPAAAPPSFWGARRTLRHILETGVAVALTGFFVILITGGFSDSHLVAPIQPRAIDPQSLRAEAQAIDIQIQLAHLNYDAVSAAAESTAPTAVGMAAPKKSASKKTAVTGTATSTNGTSTTVSVDDALDALSQ